MWEDPLLGADSEGVDLRGAACGGFEKPLSALRGCLLYDTVEKTSDLLYLLPSQNTITKYLVKFVAFYFVFMSGRWTMSFAGTEIPDSNFT
jgi:hypothetical protein